MLMNINAQPTSCLELSPKCNINRVSNLKALDAFLPNACLRDKPPIP